MTDEDLDLVETDALLSALKRRCDGVLYVEFHNQSANAEAHSVIYKGGRMLALGLAAQAQAYLLHVSGETREIIES